MNTTTATTSPNPLAATLAPLQRRCWALAGALDARLEAGPLRALRVNFDPLSVRPWWHLAVLSDAGGWELQAGGWEVSLDRPRWLRSLR